MMMVMMINMCILASHQPGDVPVTVVTHTGQRLGMTCFRYVDEMREMVRQLVKDPTLQSLWFAIWSQEHGFFGNDSNIAQVLGPLDMQDQGKRIDLLWDYFKPYLKFAISSITNIGFCHPLVVLFFIGV